MSREVFGKLGIKSDRQLWVKKVAEKHLPGDLVKFNILREILHIHQGQEIRDTGMLRSDMLNEDLYDDLLEAGYISDVHWRSMRKYELIELTPKGVVLAQEIERAILDPQRIAEIPHITLLSTWLESLDRSGNPPAIEKEFLNGGYRFWVPEIDIVKELPGHNKQAHSMLLKAFSFLKSHNLATEVYYYVTTRGGETRGLHVVLSRYLAGLIINAVRPKTRYFAQNSFREVWKKHEPLRSSINFVIGSLWKARPVEEDRKDLVLSLFNEYISANGQLPDIEPILKGDARLELDDTSTFETFFQNKWTSAVGSIDTDLTEILKKLIEEDREYSSGDDLDGAPEPSVDVASKLATLLRMTPMISIEQLSKYFSMPEEVVVDTILDLVSKNKVDGTLDNGMTIFYSSEAAKKAAELKSSKTSLSTCFYCGKDLGVLLIRGGTVVCPNCGKTNIGE